MAGAGIRWGLNAEQRTTLGLQACGEHNSAWFGLRRMLLGYASGSRSVQERMAGRVPLPGARLSPMTKSAGWVPNWRAFWPRCSSA